MPDKKFKLSKEEFKKLLPVPMGSCIASDKITVDGLSVRYMYREEPRFETDSGWSFFSGTETQEYVDNPDNIMIYDINTIANYDQSIIPYLKYPIGSELQRTHDNIFELVEA